MAKKSKTPDWVDELIDLREEIGEDDYTDYWHRLNKYRDDPERWDKEGKKIIAEIKGEEGTFTNKKDALEYQSEHGGRIVRRDASGRFNKRGRTFQVVGGK